MNTCVILLAALLSYVLFIYRELRKINIAS